MALLPRRAALLIVMFLAVLALALVPAALADGRDVLSDAQDNDRIDRCYTRQELVEAARLARADQREYGNVLDLVQQAQVTNVADEDGDCEGRSEGTGGDGGFGTGVWVGLAVAVGLVAAGAGAWARRNAGDEGDGEDEGDGTGGG